MKYITIIPARGGSKRFPGKNIYHFIDRPLIAHSIDYSKCCRYISETYVSTDNAEIKEVSKQYGAQILNRPEELGGDYVSSADVLKNAVLGLESKGVDFDYVILLQATNPLRPIHLLDAAIQIIEENQYESLMSVSICDLKLGKIQNHKFIPWNYYFGQRSQDMERYYYENGLLYISSKNMLKSGKIIDENSFPLVVDHVFGEVDIDTKDDLEYAEFVWNKYKKSM